MTIKQKRFIKAYQDSGNATQAVIDSGYKVKSRAVAQAVGSENLLKPIIQNSLAKNIELFESTIVNTVKEWGNSENTRKRELSLQASYYGHDKINGKATQRIEQQTTSVSVVIDLSGTSSPVEK